MISFYNQILNKLEIRLQRIRFISRPIEISLEPTINCNSNCVMCTKRFLRETTIKGDEFLSWDIFWKVKPLFKYAVRVLFSGFGEPLLHPEYLAMLREIKKSGSFVYLFTNGIQMTEDLGKELVDVGVDMICVSIGGATKETYRKIRGIDAFEKMVSNIKWISKYKKKIGSKKPLMNFNVVAMNSLLPELELLVNLAHEIGIEHFVMPNLIVQSNSMRKESIWHNTEKAKRAFQRARDLADIYKIKFVSPSLKIYKSDCKDIFKKMFITWDGKVLSCAQERYIIGDLKKDSLASIWNGEGIIRLRKDYNEKGIEIICHNCPCQDNSPEAFLNSRVNSREYAKILF